MEDFGFGLTALGFALTIGAGIRAWRVDPDDPRYARQTWAEQIGMKQLIADEARIAAAAVFGASLQFLGSLLIYAA